VVQSKEGIAISKKTWFRNVEGTDMIECRPIESHGSKSEVNG